MDPAATVSAAPDLAATVVARATPFVLATYVAPGGLWVARVNVHGCVSIADEGEMAYEELVLQDGSGSFVADEQLINCGGLGAFGLAGLYWSPDGRFLFYTTGREGVPDGCGFWMPPVSQLDVLDRSVAYLGIAELSPDGRVLAAWRDTQLVLLPLDSGQIQPVELPEPELPLGALAWSPTSSMLAFLQVQNRCPISGASVFLSALEQPQPRLVFSPEDGQAAGLQWMGSDQLLILGEDGQGWIYDLESGALAAHNP